MNDQMPSIRITGVLLQDAMPHRTTGTEPHLLIDMQIQPLAGVPCWARLDVGADLAAQMHAEAQLAGLRKHALVSLACQGLGLPRTDHGRALHTLIKAHGLVVTHHRVTPDQPIENRHAL